MSEDTTITFSEFAAVNREADTKAQRLANRAAASVREWQQKNEADGGVCDFCAHLLVPGEYATWVTESEIAATMTATTHEGGTGRITNVFDPFWAACTKQCDAVVAERDPVKLAKHAIDNRDVERVGEISTEARKIVEADLVTLYTEFFKQNPNRVELNEEDES